jgi:hypothetical protein
MPKPSEVLVYVNNDGSARSLTDAEKEYVDAYFAPFDGGRPYIKSHYWQRNGWGELRGYLDRKNVPSGMLIGSSPSPSAQQNTPQAVANSVIELIRTRGRA